MRFAEVAVDIPGGRARTFTYAMPAGMDLRPGHAVWVPFGARTRRGVVFSLAARSPVAETREVLRLLAPEPLLSGAQLAVARWIADYYRTGLFAAASLMLPPGFAERLLTYVFLPPEGSQQTEDMTPREQRAANMLRKAGRMRRDTLGRKLGRGGTAVVDRMLRRGRLLSESHWERPLSRPLFRTVLRLRLSGPDLERALADRRAPKRARLLRWLRDNPDGATRAELTESFGASAVSGALARGWVEARRVRVERDPLAGRRFQQSFPLDPTPDQARAIAAVAGAIEEAAAERDRGDGGLRPGRKFLLFGVTGSGKTEVYLQAAAACLAAGRGVLVLLPEIALTPQNLARFASRFAGQIALLHSGLPAGERFDQWWAIHRGDYRIVLGSRGAVFAPLRDVGLIVIDEEHEWTYKHHDAAPRYHARRVAEKLSDETGAVLLLGSATPDVETFRRAERGMYRLLRLSERVPERSPRHGRTAARQARVQIVDMRAELRAGRTGPFSRVLETGVREALEAGGRVILFLNRRGAAAFMQCMSCGAVRRCRRCDTALTYHRGSARGEPDRLVCHYCNNRVRVATRCPACREERLRPMGYGTQGLVEEARARFPGTDILRWDRDAARTAAAHQEILDRFVSGKARILVGTQMIAKGLDIPDVTMVGVVSADTGLAIPDFRAGERAFQVLTQVAGRVGRSPRGGRAIIQTFQPDHYAILAAAAQDFEAFYATELELRRRYANPPFTRLVRLLYADPDAGRAREQAVAVARALWRQRYASGEGATQVLGPSPAYPFRVRGLTRWHLLLKGAAPARLLDRVTLSRGWLVDVDPIAV